MTTGTVTLEPAPPATAAGLAEALQEPGSANLLEVVLAAVFPSRRDTRTGRRRFEQIDLDAVAGAFAVAPGTVRRWLRATGGRPALPRARAVQLAQLAGPSQATRTRERLNIEWAQAAVARLRLGRGRGRAAMEQEYGDTGRLEPHMVMVLELSGTGLRKVVTARVSPTRPETVTRARRAGEVVDFTAVPLPNWWAAELVRYAILSHVDDWRVEAAIRIRQKGHTQTWVAQAPLPPLNTTLQAAARGEDQ